MIACCTGLHLSRGACRPASPVSGVHVSRLTDSPALAKFRRAPMPRRSSWSSKARGRLAACFIANVRIEALTKRCQSRTSARRMLRSHPQHSH
jgi:hypothetical protein